VHQHRAGPAAQCRALLKLGEAIGRAVASWPGDEKVLVLGTGGLSHQLDGERAGFINKDFDLRSWTAWWRRPALGLPVQHPPAGGANRHPGRRIADVAGHARHALGAKVQELHRNYHIPISNTASGLMLMC
jgi:protocatechuate 4,5-dioxygenase beta chain